MPKPFIKWAGGKTKFLPKIIDRMPDNYNRYIEPFLGAGALFLNIMPSGAVINDINTSLMNCWNIIQACPELLMDKLAEIQERFNNSVEEEKPVMYYDIRNQYNHDTNMPVTDFAAYFIFLNKCGFNGLYRENKKGEFNVPFGKKKKITLFEYENIMQIYGLLNETDVLCGDFENICRNHKIREHDFVFFDSPYIDSFAGYNGNGFHGNDHIRLKELFDYLTSKNVYCMATNNNCQYAKELYKKYHIEEEDVMHAINRNGNGRQASEIIITNY